MALSRDVTKKLSGNYSIQEGGIAHDVAVEVIAGVVERGRSGDMEAFLKKLDQMSRALNAGLIATPVEAALAESCENPWTDRASSRPVSGRPSDQLLCEP